MRRRSGLEIPETLGDACDPATMALIVYDMQAGVLGQLPGGGAEAVERVSRVLTAARAGGYPVFFTRHMSLPVKLMGTSQLRTAMAWQQVDSPEKVQSWFLRDTPGWEIVADLAPRADEAVFDKLAMSAFAGTPMEMALRDLGIRSFAIAGVALEIGIAPTVWHAVDLGLIPVVVTDACGGRDRPAMERVLDDFRFSGDALLTETATITPLLAAGEARP
ncbi:MAG TPA: isochorismatase family cysteine hydrolase [Trebonia sp.]